MTSEQPWEIEPKPGDMIEFTSKDGQIFGGTVWQPPTQPENLLAGDTFIRLNGRWLPRYSTARHVRKEDR